jgi:protein-tyrosine phosphatase
MDVTSNNVSNDEALAKALQEDEDILAGAAVSRKKPLSMNNSCSEAESSWGSWFSQASTQALKMASDAAVAANVAASITKDQAVAVANAATEMSKNYDMDTIFQSNLNSSSNSNSNSNNNSAGKKSKKKASVNEELDLVYITENVIAMAFPFDPTPKSRKGGSGPQTGNNITDVAAYLKHHHDGKYMIWNISEENYNTAIFDQQVLEYKFPGHPAPPLGLLFKICMSIQSWLDADHDNVAVIHCLTGKGRTAALTACVLSWLGEFTSPIEGLSYVAERKGIAVDTLTIASQRRYVQYFANTLDGVRPRSEPLLLRRIIMNTVPLFSFSPGTVGESESGCCPYIQLFKNGKLICTSVPTGSSDAMAGQMKGANGNGNGNGSNNKKEHLQQEGTILRWIGESEGCISFNVDCALQGDILLRCRHTDANGSRVSMFRSAFHTGYVPNGVMRLTRQQLDGTEGTQGQNRFEEDFFIDLIFAPVDTATATATAAADASTFASMNQTKEKGNSETEEAPQRGTHSNKKVLTVAGPPSDSGLVIEAACADMYDSSLHKDTRFWEEVDDRKSNSHKAKKRVSRKFNSHATNLDQEKFSITDDNDNDDDDNDDGNSNDITMLTGSICNNNSNSNIINSSSGSRITNVGNTSEKNKDKQREAADLDLIEALALAAAEEDDNENNSSNKDNKEIEIGDTGTGKVHTHNTSKPTLEGDKEKELDDIDEALLVNATVESVESVKSAESPTKELDSELLALEILEKELGLDDLTESGTELETVASIGQEGSSNTYDDDNFDELEAYLEGLSGGSGN